MSRVEWEDGRMGTKVRGGKCREKKRKKEKRKRRNPSHHCLNRERWAQVNRAQRRRLGMQLISMVNGKQKKTRLGTQGRKV